MMMMVKRMLIRWSELIAMVKLILMAPMVRRSNVVYQDGLRNVNSMIFNSQVDLLKVPSGKNPHMH